MTSETSNSEWLKMPGLRHITDHKGRDVYVVQIGRQGKNSRKEFILDHYPSRALAEAAALAHRAIVLATVLPISRRDYHSILRSNNKSGVSGVFYKKPTYAGAMGYWTAHIKLRGQPQEDHTFSIKRHGFEGARELAIAQRLKMLENAQGWLAKRPQNHPPSWVPEPSEVALIRPPRGRRTKRAPEPNALPVGVRLVRGKVKRASGEVVYKQYWCVSYTVGIDAIRMRCFFVDKYGHDQALKLALEQHAQWQICPPQKHPWQA
jgi:hypothetical protein